MPSFDIVSRVDLQEVDNAVNNTKKAIAQRFDFRNAKYELTFDRKEKKLAVHAEDLGKVEAICEMFRTAAAKRNLDPRTFKFGDKLPGAGGSAKREITLRDGLEQDLAKKIVKLIKDTKLKVQASIQGEEVRVMGKQIDDLQSVMKLLNASEIEAPLQFINLKS